MGLVSPLFTASHLISVTAISVFGRVRVVNAGALLRLKTSPSRWPYNPRVLITFLSHFGSAAYGESAFNLPAIRQIYGGTVTLGRNAGLLKNLTRCRKIGRVADISIQKAIMRAIWFRHNRSFKTPVPRGSFVMNPSPSRGANSRKLRKHTG